MQVAVIDPDLSIQGSILARLSGTSVSFSLYYSCLESKQGKTLRFRHWLDNNVDAFWKEADAEKTVDETLDASS
jgi:hypothetical protein